MKNPYILAEVEAQYRLIYLIDKNIEEIARDREKAVDFISRFFATSGRGVVYQHYRSAVANIGEQNPKSLLLLPMIEIKE